MSYVGTDGNDQVYNSVEFTLYGLNGQDALGGFDISFQAYGGNGNDTLYQNGTGYLDAWGGYGNDWIVVASGSSTASYLYGDEGSDIIEAGQADDYIDGGQDADALYGGSGDDSIYGGDGNDTNTSITAGASALGSAYSITKLGGLYGGAGNDYLDGGRGDDYLDGGDDDDILLGGEGNDRLIGGTGIDRMTGGAGNDYYQVDNAADVIEEFKGGVASGKDTVATLVSYQLREGVSVEKFATATTSSTTAINLVGNEVDQAILGNNGVNKIYGRLGNDTLTGNGGNDAFIFDTKLSATTNVDRITDFSNFFGNDDTIRLDDAVFTDLTLGTLNASFFKANSSGVATDSNDRIIYNTSTGALYYDTNGNGSGGAVQFAILSGQPLITASDFLIV